MKSGKLIRIGEELLKKLEQIKQQEEKRGNSDVSWKIAGEILSRRIDMAGGIKQ